MSRNGKSKDMREPILRGLCASDIAGFQSHRSSSNFLYTCYALLEDDKVDFDAASVHVNGPTTWARCYPISVDLAGMRRALGSPLLQSAVEMLQPKLGEQTIIRVDRAEPSRHTA